MGEPDLLLEVRWSEPSVNENPQHPTESNLSTRTPSGKFWEWTQVSWTPACICPGESQENWEGRRWTCDEEVKGGWGRGYVQRETGATAQQ